MKVFIFWSDYDGPMVTECLRRGEAEEEISKLIERERKNSYGITIHSVVEGRNLFVNEKTVEITEIKLSDRI